MRNTELPFLGRLLNQILRISKSMMRLSIFKGIPISLQDEKLAILCLMQDGH